MTHVLLKLSKLTLGEETEEMNRDPPGKPAPDSVSGLTRDGKLNSLTKPKSSPVARSFWSLVSEAAFTKLNDGHIPSQVGPRTDVQVAQSIFSNWTQKQHYDLREQTPLRKQRNMLSDLRDADVLSASSWSLKEELIFSSGIHLEEFTCREKIRMRC